MRDSALRIAFLLGLTSAAVAVAWARGGNARAVRKAFDAWAADKGSIYDLMDDDAQVVLAGTAPHTGSYRKDVFMRDVAGPLTDRFATPPLPQLRRLWAAGETVAVLADAIGTTRDNQPYAQSYVFVFDMAGGRITKVTEFLDMEAFNAVWDRVGPNRPMLKSHVTATRADGHAPTES